MFPARREVKILGPSSRVSTTDLLPGFLARSISTIAGTACLSTWRERKTREFTATCWVETSSGYGEQDRSGTHGTQACALVEKLLVCNTDKRLALGTDGSAVRKLLGVRHRIKHFWSSHLDLSSIHPLGLRCLQPVEQVYPPPALCIAMRLYFR